MSSFRHRAGAAAPLMVLALVVTPATALADTTEQPGTPDDAAGETATLTLLNFNDFHGRLNDDGLAMAKNIEAEREANPNSLLVSAGDNVGGTLFVSSASDDNPTLDFLNVLGLQASALGNHEFDQGREDLDTRIVERSAFPQLGANVLEADGEPAYEPYTLLETESGHTVAVIGAVTPETTTLVSPAGIADLTFADPVEHVNRYAEALSDGDDANGEADIIVAAYHEGVSQADPLNAPIVTDTHAAVDVIFTGHTHQEYIIDAPVPGDAERTRPVMQSGEYADHLGTVDLEISADGEVLGYTAENIASVVPESDDEYAQFEAEIAANPMLAELSSIIDDAEAVADEVGSVEMGTIQDYVTTGIREGEGGMNFDQRDLESTMGHLVADAWLYAANETETGAGEVDFGIVNPGGLRDEFPGGLRGDQSLQVPATLTVAQAVGVNPFANTLFLVDITGAQLRETLEQQWQTSASGEVPGRPFLQLGLSENVRYTYTTEVRTSGDDTVGHDTRGSNIDQIWVNDVPVLDEDVFTVALPSFLAAGGDNFRALANGHNHRDTGLIDTDAFHNYVQDGLGGEVGPRYNKQAVQLTELADEISVDGELSLTLADLGVQSFAAPDAGQLTAEIAAYPGDDAHEPLADDTYQLLGTVAVDADSASAAVSLNLAEAQLSAGTHVLRFTDATTGTVVTRTVELVGSTDDADNTGGSGTGDVTATPTPSTGGSGGSGGGSVGSDDNTDNTDNAGGADNTDGADNTSDAKTAGKDRGGALAATGAEITGLALGALLILGTGVTLFLVRRRSAH
ncbi:bifunctional metallophosphatase/5'-nucleotidase [Citricoccus muralis]|uniref:Bifunctional UDP-sugar hydrolase/5'-nucleotidase n=1 Tax=Citricoccus muralis TaxID=169134 RepID=A0ABY8H8L2_9MICC|nr:bifunctional UDP-sugar hydrolase/5'-nucleotidase [Citricoccus muralis]WFP17498.1 bifunctional UDP-sugar hydrolase/5'-nucleotidase [Citricoccus muralis]